MTSSFFSTHCEDCEDGGTKAAGARRRRRRRRRSQAASLLISYLGEEESLPPPPPPQISGGGRGGVEKEKEEERGPFSVDRTQEGRRKAGGGGGKKKKCVWVSPPPPPPPDTDQPVVVWCVFLAVREGARGKELWKKKSCWREKEGGVKEAINTRAERERESERKTFLCIKETLLFSKGGRRRVFANVLLKRGRVHPFLPLLPGEGEGGGVEQRPSVSLFADSGLSLRKKEEETEEEKKQINKQVLFPAVFSTCRRQPGDAQFRRKKKHTQIKRPCLLRTSGAPPSPSSCCCCCCCCCCWWMWRRPSATARSSAPASGRMVRGWETKSKNSLRDF